MGEVLERRGGHDHHAHKLGEQDYKDVWVYVKKTVSLSLSLSLSLSGFMSRRRSLVSIKHQAGMASMLRIPPAHAYRVSSRKLLSTACDQGARNLSGGTDGRGYTQLCTNKDANSLPAPFPTPSCACARFRARTRERVGERDLCLRPLSPHVSTLPRPACRCSSKSCKPPHPPKSPQPTRHAITRRYTPLVASCTAEEATRRWRAGLQPLESVCVLPALEIEIEIGIGIGIGIGIDPEIKTAQRPR